MNRIHTAHTVRMYLLYINLKKQSYFMDSVFNFILSTQLCKEHLFPIFCIFRIFRFAPKQICLFRMFRYGFETPKLTETNRKILFLVSRNKPKINRNRLSFGLFRFEPKKKFVCFEDTLHATQQHINSAKVQFQLNLILSHGWSDSSSRTPIIVKYMYSTVAESLDIWNLS
jgi:hypothetical protein